MESVEDEHRGYHVLYAVIAVGKVVHGLMLFVDDTDAGLMGAAGDGFDVFCRLALLCELGVDSFGSFDGGLGVEFGWKRYYQHWWERKCRKTVPGYETLKRMFSIT